MMQHLMPTIDHMDCSGKIPMCWEIANSWMGKPSSTEWQNEWGSFEYWKPTGWPLLRQRVSLVLFRLQPSNPIHSWAPQGSIIPCLKREAEGSQVCMRSYFKNSAQVHLMWRRCFFSSHLLSWLNLRLKGNSPPYYQSEIRCRMYPEQEPGIL